MDASNELKAIVAEDRFVRVVEQDIYSVGKLSRRLRCVRSPGSEFIFGRKVPGCGLWVFAVYLTHLRRLKPPHQEGWSFH